MEKPQIKHLTKEQLPQSIRNSKVLDEQDLYWLSMFGEVPLTLPAFEDERVKSIVQYYSLNPDDMEKELHLYAKELLANGDTDKAWQVLLSNDTD